MNNKGLQLSMSVVVLLVISIVIFTYSVYFLYNIIKINPVVEERIDLQTKQAIEQMLFQENELVAIPFHSKEAVVGDTVIFWMGVRNVGSNEESFTVTTTFEGAFTKDYKKLDVDESIVNSWVRKGNFNIGSLSAKEYKKVPLAITVGELLGSKPTLPGSYIFKVCVKKSSNRENNREDCYGGFQGITVNVD